MAASMRRPLKTPLSTTDEEGGGARTRETRQRGAIRRAIDTAQRPLLPSEILELAQQEVSALGIATIYRNIKLLLEEQAIRVVELPGDLPRYESAHHAHHHHFQCRQCARVFDIHACPGDFSALAPQGFQIDGHELTLYGTCVDCAKPQRASRRR